MSRQDCGHFLGLLYHGDELVTLRHPPSWSEPSGLPPQLAADALPASFFADMMLLKQYPDQDEGTNMHTETHPLAGQTVVLKTGTSPDPSSPLQLDQPADGVKFRIEDWWDKLTGGSWMYADGNPAALKYALRIGLADERPPLDDEVVYGKIGAFGHIVHTSELGEVVASSSSTI